MVVDLLMAGRGEDGATVDGRGVDGDLRNDDGAVTLIDLEMVADVITPLIYLYTLPRDRRKSHVRVKKYVSSCSLTRFW